ncbi:hypothetical protein O181_077565 [Austropuccinia psidii MF-1]|uniref:RNA-directed DNA polymerase n=1 Tax=Austropuccinia psidii MF-1 TaxID=1389203 RepID=A0A9Q3IG38_9BASI|nr:hypothetical protein [Austropuccinia psidii MF-1]
MSELPEKSPIISLDSSESPSLFVTHYTKYMVELPSFPSFECDFLVIDHDTPKGEDLILGFDLLNHFNPSIDWRQGLITINAYHKDYYDPSKSFSNDLSSAESCAALVVFKEIQDVGEENSVSSLHLFFGNMDLPPSSYHEYLEELWDEEQAPEEIETVLKVVPYVYHQYLDLFSKVKAEKLTPHQACDHHIKLEGSLPPVGVIYSLSNGESDTIRADISENVEKGFIWPSSSTGAPVLFVKQKDNGLRLCVAYHKLNAVTRKNKYPVPPMNQLITVFNGSSIFSKIDLCGAYNLLRIKEGDEHLTFFRTKYGSSEYFVMPFGLTNAPASFQNLVNDIFYHLLDIYVVVYLDYIMGFSKSEEEDATHVSTALARLRANNLFAKASKCQFHLSSVEYLGYVVSSEGLKMDQAEFQPILNWPAPRNLKALQSILGSSNFYWRFIKNYSKKSSSLTSFLKKDSRFPFKEEALSQFQKLKQAFTTSPNLLYPPFCRRLPAELNHEIDDKELLGIVWALKYWRAFILSHSSPSEVLTNHSSLQYFMSSNILTCCQACWAELLSEFHFSITYHPGRLATLPDALSCQNNVYPERGEISSSRIQ